MSDLEIHVYPAPSPAMDGLNLYHLVRVVPGRWRDTVRIGVNAGDLFDYADPETPVTWYRAIPGGGFQATRTGLYRDIL